MLFAAMSRASAAAAVRVSTPSLRKIRSRCFAIVAGRVPRISAVSRLVFPRAIHTSTSVSRPVNPSVARSAGQISCARSSTKSTFLSPSVISLTRKQSSPRRIRRVRDGRESDTRPCRDIQSKMISGRTPDFREDHPMFDPLHSDADRMTIDPGDRLDELVSRASPGRALGIAVHLPGEGQVVRGERLAIRHVTPGRSLYVTLRKSFDTPPFATVGTSVASTGW